MAARITPGDIDAVAREVAAAWLEQTVKAVAVWRRTGDLDGYRAATRDVTQRALTDLAALDCAAIEWGDKHERDTRFNRRVDIDEGAQVEASLHRVIGAVRAGIRGAQCVPERRNVVRALPQPRVSPFWEQRRLIEGWRW